MIMPLSGEEGRRGLLTSHLLQGKDAPLLPKDAVLPLYHPHLSVWLRPKHLPH